MTDALYNFSIDRSAGVGRGWLFKFDSTGNLLGQIELTDGTKYHPGGIDYDGEHIWVAVAEYRPNSRSNIFRVDPDTLEFELVFTEADHIGGIVHNVHQGTLHGVSWGSRRLLHVESRWNWSQGECRVLRPGAQPAVLHRLSGLSLSGSRLHVVRGVGGYTTPLGSIAFGGVDLVDLRRARLEHQVPVNIFINEGAGPNPRVWR